MSTSDNLIHINEASFANILAQAGNKPVLSRIHVEVADGVAAEVDMIVGDVAWVFVGGDQPSELQRLDRIVSILLTVHALRLSGQKINHVSLFQMITGLTTTWPIGPEMWPSSIASLLTAFVQARACFPH